MENILDFLMKLTETRNSVLSKATAFDPSYISRIRSGQRDIPKSPQFIEPAAAYFARNLRTPEQLARLSAAMGSRRPVPSGREELQDFLVQLLTNEEPPAANPVSSFLDGFALASNRVVSMPRVDANVAGAGQAQAPGAAPSQPEGSAPGPNDWILQNVKALETDSDDAWFFYGNAGKRRAVELFLGRLCTTGKAYRLHLFSDEEMSWLYEDAGFAKRWAAMLMQLLSTGSRIRIPHSITRDSNEMIESIQKWIPLYMTGAIEPYYYPRLRDGVYHRSLFIAEGDSALFSTSVGQQTDGMLNVLVTSRRAVQALEQEYASYMELCRPLMHIYGSSGGLDILSVISRFEKVQGHLINAFPLPSFCTASPACAEKLQQLCPDAPLMDRYQRSYAAFRSRMRKGDSFTDILHLPRLEEVQEHGIVLPLSSNALSQAGEVRISTEILHLHLKNAIRLLKKESSYNVVLSDVVPANICLSVSEQQGVLMYSGSGSTMGFEIHEPHMTIAFWDYLNRIAETRNSDRRQETIQQLEHYCAALEG